MTSTESLSLLGRATGGLIVVIVVIGLVARVVRRARGENGSSGLRVVERIGLSREANLTVVEVANRMLLLGVTAQGVTMLADLDEDDAATDPSVDRALAALPSTLSPAFASALPAALSSARSARSSTDRPSAGTTGARSSTERRAVAAIRDAAARNALTRGTAEAENVDEGAVTVGARQRLKGSKGIRRSKNDTPGEDAGAPAAPRPAAADAAPTAARPAPAGRSLPVRSAAERLVAERDAAHREIARREQAGREQESADREQAEQESAEREAAGREIARRRPDRPQPVRAQAPFEPMSLPRLERRPMPARIALDEYPDLASALRAAGRTATEADAAPATPAPRTRAEAKALRAAVAGGDDASRRLERSGPEFDGTFESTFESTLEATEPVEIRLVDADAAPPARTGRAGRRALATARASTSGQTPPASGSVLDPNTWKQGIDALRDLTVRRG